MTQEINLKEIHRAQLVSLEDLENDLEKCTLNNLVATMDYYYPAVSRAIYEFDNKHFNETHIQKRWEKLDEVYIFWVKIGDYLVNNIEKMNVNPSIIQYYVDEFPADVPGKFYLAEHWFSLKDAAKELCSLLGYVRGTIEDLVNCSEYYFDDCNEQKWDRLTRKMYDAPERVKHMYNFLLSYQDA